MIKRELKPKEIPGMIRACYESDPDYIQKFHETGERGLDYCINQTVADFVLNDIKLYVLHTNKFIGYFGEENFNGEKYLTGFWIMPEFRGCKDQVWNMVVDHFDGEFKAGVYSRNKPFTKYLENNGCKFIENNHSVFGPGKFYMYKENS